VIHVGDYLYREDMCPPAKQSFCGGAPSGDNWETWKADFFAPAAKLLAASPWVFTRGNHEDCERHPWKAEKCEAIQAPYPVQLGSFQLVVFDSSDVKDKLSAEAIDRYAHELASIRASPCMACGPSSVLGLQDFGERFRRYACQRRAGESLAERRQINPLRRAGPRKSDCRHERTRVWIRARQPRCRWLELNAKKHHR
jgi:hypothetical protein